MNRLPIHLIIISFVFSLVVAACNNSNERPTSEPTTELSARATLTTTPRPSTPIPAEPIETARATETPPNTPTTIPTETPIPLPEFLQNGRQLGVNWGWRGALADFIPPADKTDSPIVMYRRYSPDGVFLLNPITDEVIVERHFEDASEFYTDFFGDLFYIAVQFEDEPEITIEQWNVRNGELNWSVTVNHPDIDEVLAIEEGLIIIDSKLYPATKNTLIFLDSSEGRINWQKSFLEDCYLYSRDMKVANSQIQILCDVRLWLISLNDGSVDDTLYMRQGDIHEFFVADQMIFLIREVGGFRYLESWDLDLSKKLWSTPVSMEVWRFVTDGNDVIYRDRNQIFRQDGLTGDVIWQTEVEGDVPLDMVVSGQWLLAGSRVGYLHILDVKSGEVRWKEDIWASIEPRELFIKPIALLDDEIILELFWGFLSIGVSQNKVIVEPTSAPTPTPTIMPTPSPLPTFTNPANGDLPEAPEDVAVWPTAIVAFLNSSPSNNGRIEAMLEKWTNGYQNLSYIVPFESDNQFQRVDLNGDGRQEFLMALSDPRYIDGDGWILVVQQEANGQYAIAWSEMAHIPILLSVTDLNDDDTTDFVAGDWWLGIHTASDGLFPVGWNGEEIVALSQEPIHSTNILYETIMVEDTDNDGFVEIVFQGGTYGSAGAGLTRNSTFTYVWSEEGYVLESKVPDLPQEYYFFLVDANDQFVAGNYEAAIAMYESSIDTEDAIYNSYDVDHQRAFAEFQLMLAYLLLGDEESAVEWATSGNYPDQFYSEVKQIFWDSYQDTHNWTAAAEAARTRVRLGGIEQNQLSSWLGYANSILTLEEILPCADCLQGSIGSLYVP